MASKKLGINPECFLSSFFLFFYRVVKFLSLIKKDGEA